MTEFPDYKYRPRKRAKVKRTSEWKRYSGEYDTVSESKEVVEVANKVTNRHSGNFQPGQASSHSHKKVGTWEPGSKSIYGRN